MPRAFAPPLVWLRQKLNDVAGRKIAEFNGNGELTQFSYAPASNLLTLTDGNTNVTTWNYDPYGRATTKVAAASHVVFS